MATFKGDKHVVAVGMSFNSQKFFISRAESAMQFFISFFFLHYVMIESRTIEHFFDKDWFPANGWRYRK